MKFCPYIYNHSEEKVQIRVRKATRKDLAVTTSDPRWQSDWNNAGKEDGEIYSFRTLDDELVALGRYVVEYGAMYVYIAYIEAQASSNPTIVGKENKKYHGIGRLLIAFGIKLSVDNDFGGDVVFEAKTDELGEYYKSNLSAIELPTFDGLPRRFMIAGSSARKIFSLYLN